MLEAREVPDFQEILKEYLKKRAKPLGGFTVMKVGGGYRQMLEELKEIVSKRGSDISSMTVKELWEAMNKTPFVKIKGETRDIYLIPLDFDLRELQETMRRIEALLQEIRDALKSQPRVVETAVRGVIGKGEEVEEIGKRVESKEERKKEEVEERQLERQKSALRIVWEHLDKKDENTEFMVDEIARELGIERDKVSSALAYLVQIGILKRSVKDGGVRVFRKTKKWRLPKS